MRKITRAKRNLKKHPVQFVLRYLMVLIGLNLMAVGIAWVYQLSQIQPVYAAVEYRAKELSVKDYVRQEVERAGLSWNEVECLMEYENKGWNVWAQGVNNNKTTDSGLWQINSVHKNEISLQDRFDYKKATAWAIKKRLDVGHWNDWYGFRYSCK